jgi:hypothetical protein
MLKLAKPYEEELNKLWYSTWKVLKYKYVHGTYFEPLEVSKDCSLHEEYVCIREVNGVEEIIGYIDLCNYRLVNIVSVDVAVNFTDSPLFAKDLLKLVHEIFKRGTRKIIWCANAKNPALNSYKRINKRYEGVVEGVLREDRMTWDNELDDTIMFGILRSDYINSDYVN